MICALYAIGGCLVGIGFTCLFVIWLNRRYENAAFKRFWL